MKDGKLTAADWVRTLGPGLLAGAFFVAFAMVIENKVIKVGAELTQ